MKNVELETSGSFAHKGLVLALQLHPKPWQGWEHLGSVDCAKSLQPPLNPQHPPGWVLLLPNRALTPSSLGKIGPEKGRISCFLGQGSLITEQARKK